MRPSDSLEPLGPRSGSPWAHLDADAVLARRAGTRCVRPQTHRARSLRRSAPPDLVEEARGSPSLPSEAEGMLAGPPSEVRAPGPSNARSRDGVPDRLLRTCRGPTPRRVRPLLAHLTEGTLLPSSNTALSAPGTHRFRGRTPRPARSRGCAVVAATGASLATVWAGSPFARRDFHPRDDDSQFQSVITDLHSLRRALPGRTISSIPLDRLDFTPLQPSTLSFLGVKAASPKSTRKRLRVSFLFRRAWPAISRFFSVGQLRRRFEIGHSFAILPGYARVTRSSRRGTARAYIET
jgi:hypothetical protein